MNCIRPPRTTNEDRWVTVNYMVSIHGASKDTLYVTFDRLKKEQNEVEWLEKRGKALLVNETYLKKIQKYRKELWLYCHDLYYYFVATLEKSEGWLAEQMHIVYPEVKVNAWYRYLNHDLWGRVDNVSITSTQLSLRTMRFAEVGTELKSLYINDVPERRLR